MEKEREIEDYKKRNSEWRNLSLNHLSIVNNTFTSLALGFLVFVFKSNIISDFTISILCADTKPTLIFCSLLFILISISIGLLILLTRLYDFRISRHLALTRQRVMSHYNSTKGLLPYNNSERKYNFCDRFNALCKIIFCKIDFIHINEIKKKEKIFIKEKFVKLQGFANILGSATWRWLKLQIFSLLISIILYWIYIII